MPSHTRSFRDRGVHSGVDVLAAEVLRVFEANPMRTAEEIHAALRRRGCVVGRRSLRNALDRFRRRGEVTIEHLNSRLVIYTWVGSGVVEMPSTGG